jgi:RHS repeat-associated protein
MACGRCNVVAVDAAATLESRPLFLPSGYNQESEVVSRRNVVNTAMNETYSYDNLGQLTSFQRGAHSQSWTPDALGNFTSVTTDGTGQSRTANQQNEYTSISGQGVPAYDADGNLTADGVGNTYVYDAWNRLVAIKNSSTGATVASYVYDGLNRRIQISESNSLTDSYYSSSDQGLENYQSSTVTFIAVWSPVYVNALVYSAKGNPLQRYYALQDANWNTTAWVVDGTVVEREAYDPFGAVTVLSPGWGVQSSPLHLASGFQGMGYDWLVSLNFADNRVYDPALMRWLQTDPLGLNAGDNGYEMEGNDPTNLVDPSGLWPYKWPWEKDASWSFEGSLIYDVIDKSLEPIRMGGDLMRAGQAGINNAVGGTPYVPEWRSKLARGCDRRFGHLYAAAVAFCEADGRF